MQVAELERKAASAEEQLQRIKNELLDAVRVKLSPSMLQCTKINRAALIARLYLRILKYNDVLRYEDNVVRFIHLCECR